MPLLSLLVSNRKAERAKKRLLLRNAYITLSNTVNERDENHIMVNSNHALHTVARNILFFLLQIILPCQGK